VIFAFAGDAQMAPEVTPLDPTAVGSVVRYGTSPGVYMLKSTPGVSLVYSQLYNFPGLLNYTSGIIHHVRLTGMRLHDLVVRFSYDFSAKSK